MKNRCKTLLRDHSVPEVILKACLRHYSVSAVSETITVQGPNRPPRKSKKNQTYEWSHKKGLISNKLVIKVKSFKIFLYLIL